MSGATVTVNCFEERFRAEWLHQVAVKSRRFAFAKVSLFGTPGNRDESATPQECTCAQMPGKFVAVHGWQMDVEQCDLWLKIHCRGERCS